MKKILSMELRRVSRSIGFYLIPIIQILLVIFADLIRALAASSGDSISNPSLSLIRYSLLIGTSVVMIAHWSAERKNGFIKNIAGSVGGRYKLTIAKMIVSSTVFLIHMAFGLIVLAANDAVIGDDAAKNLICGSPKTLILFALIGLAILALSLLLYESSNSAVLCYIVAIFLGGGVLEDIIVQLVYLINSSFESWRYLLVMGVSTGQNPFAADLIRTLAYTAVFAVPAVILGGRKDVR